MRDYWGTKPFKVPQPPADIVDYKASEFRYLGQIVRPSQITISISTIGKDYAGGATIVTVEPGREFHITAFVIHYQDIDSIGGPTPATLKIGLSDTDLYLLLRTDATTNVHRNAMFFPAPFPKIPEGTLKIFHPIAIPGSADYRADITLHGFYLQSGTPAKG
jgi:hypothetical protein